MCIIKYIYLISDYDSYKIGISKNEPSKRMKALQTGSSVELQIVNVFRSKYANILEKTLHRTYNLEHKRGEWFYLTQPQVDNFLLECDKIEKTFIELEKSDNNFFKKML
jgi:hypothetical protein